MKLSDLSHRRVLVAPFNDVSVRLRDALPPDALFVGYADSHKTGPDVFSPRSAPDADFVVINSPNHWRAIATNFEVEKVLLFNKLGQELVRFDEYAAAVEKNLAFDVVLFPFNKSNIQDLSIVARELRSIGISAALIDTGSENDRNIREGLRDNADVPVVSRDQFEALRASALVSSIDWAMPFGRPELERERARGGLTIGIVDGIEDFEDSDYAFKRNAYGTVEYVLLMGTDDRKHLAYKSADTSVVGLPKMWSLFHDRHPLPRSPRVTINVNFTYGTFEEVRDEWVSAAIAACDSAGLPWIIAQHHADHGAFAPEHVSPLGIYDTIKESSIVVSRFSTVILEALALGRQVIYFNPHGETVTLYANPEGAYHLAHDGQELEQRLRAAAADPAYGREAALDFLQRKCNVLSSVPPGRLAAYRIKNLLEERRKLRLFSENSYEIDPRYTARVAYHHYDDREVEDAWQLEVYLHALGLLVKNAYRRVADVGCGSGYKLVTYLRDYDTIGYELPQNVEALTQKYPDRKWRTSDFHASHEIDADVVICSDVIEHLVDPDELMRYLSRQQFRYLLLSTPAREFVYAKDDPALFGPPRNLAHQREWTFEEFRRYVDRYFDVIDHRVTNLQQATQLVTCTPKR